METLTHPTGHSPPSAYDLIVIGGGPGGASAAITAVRSGARVLLLERGRLPRQRVCGEFISPESLQLLAALLGDEGPPLLTGATRLPAARLFLDRCIINAPVHPAAASLARFDLDWALWRAAETIGVQAHLQTMVEDVRRGELFWVKTSAGVFQARAVILATGRHSNLDAPIRSVDGRNRRLGLKAHFAERSPHPSVDLYFFEGGYCGVQPVELAGDFSRHGRVNVCALVRADVARTLPEVFAQNPQLRERARQWQPLIDPVSTSQLRFHEPQPVWDGVLRVGDAAGFVDPFIGDGISLALRSGAAAAECCTAFFQGKFSLDAAATRYAQIYRQRLLPVFRASSRLRRLLTLPRAMRVPLARLLQSSPAVARYLVSMTR
jgi:menaquinone-9 beta-reductase